MKFFGASGGKAFNQVVKAAIQDQADVGWRAELGIGADENLRWFDSAALTEELN